MPDEQRSTVRDAGVRSARRSVVLAFERVAAVAKHSARLAAARGDWEDAARSEEQAIMAEHQAALLRDAEPAAWPASRPN